MSRPRGATTFGTSAGKQVAIEAAPLPDPTVLVNVRSMQKLLQAEDDDRLANIAKAQKELLLQKRTLVEEIKSNYVLEGQLRDLDIKIGLLIHNRGNVQEVVAQSQGLSKIATSSSQSKLPDDVKKLYGHLCYILQTEPSYLGQVPKVLVNKQIQPFIQIVAFTLFGDQFSPREELLLLNVFQAALREEFGASIDMGSLLRGNSPVTKLIREYTRRDPGKIYLEDTLGPVLQTIVKEEGLDLEINPAHVLQLVINKEESATGVTSTEKKADDEEAAKDPRVQAILEPRFQEITNRCDMLLGAIMSSLDIMPYGIRWIAKQISLMTKEKFPECTEYDQATMVGGFVYLRYINPAIVTPDADAFKLVHKLTKQQRRNLVLCAKTLQNLSNFVKFGDKEQYMCPMNTFIEQNSEKLCAFFRELIDVKDPEDYLKVDTRYVDVGQSSDPVIKPTLAELNFLHHLFADHIDTIAPNSKDAVNSILKELGDPPEDAADAKEQVVILTLVNQFKTVDAAAEKETSEAQEVYNETKQLITQVLRKADLAFLPFGLRHTLPSILDACEETGKDNVGTLVTQVREKTALLKEHGRISPEDTGHVRLLQDVAKDLQDRDFMEMDIDRERGQVDRTLSRVREHREELIAQMDMFNKYLVDARSSRKGTKKKVKGKKNAAKTKVHKQSHDSLMKDGVIVESRVPEGSRKKTVIQFEIAQSGRINVAAIVHGFPVKSYTLDLDDLLERQYDNERFIEFEHVTLNINLLIHLVNAMLAK